MLNAASISHEAMFPGVDEDAAKAALVARGTGPRDLADALAELKAVKLSLRYPSKLVLGCDQTLALEDGTLFDKAPDRGVLSAQLKQLSGQVHSLYSGAVIAENGVPVWRFVDRAKMTMRPLSQDYIADYLDAEGDDLLGCVGGYRIEGRGAQLFSKIEGSHFTILGLPLLPLLAFLRVRGVIGV